MEMSEFLKQEPEVEEEETVSEELDVQKAVVESLAAEKVEQDEHISSLRKENVALKSEILELRERIEEMKASLEKIGDILAANVDGVLSSKVTLLERDPELNDRFTGETRDHVIEVLREARAEAEKTGRLRRAQILESVLLCNEPDGTLAKKRTNMEKLFKSNGNILTGAVMLQLDSMSIAYKKGEEYLLPSEIINSVY